MICTHTYPEIE